MKRLKIIKDIVDLGVVAVIRADSREHVLKLVEAIKNGGIRTLEVTMTVPGAVEIISDIANLYKDENVIIGAGTVMDPETARVCILAGAEYIVSPCVNVETIKMCNRYGVPVIPGAMTVKEAVDALEYGVDIIKIFPGSAFGPSIISAFKGPIPQGNFMPTGGVNLGNVKDWIRAGAVAIGTGGDLTKGAASGNYGLVTETAARFMAEVKAARDQEVE